MSTQKASKALLSRLAETVLTEFAQEDLYVAQAPAGLILGEEHFEVLQQLEADRLSDPASVARLVELSRIVDCIQVDRETIATPDTAPGYLSDAFTRIVDNVEFKQAPLTAEQQRRYQQAQTLLFEDPPFIKHPPYQEFCLLRADVEKKDVVLAEMRYNLKALEPSAEKDVLKDEIATFEALVKEQQEALDALDRVYSFRAAEAIIDAAEREIDEVPTTVRHMLDAIELFQITDPISNATHVACNFSPAYLSEDNWIPLKLTGEEIAKWQADGDAHSSGLDDSEIESITLDVQTVICYRPWLWAALFKNQHWHWRSPAQPVSTGGTPASGQIPAYVYGLVFARNLVVKGRISARQQFEQVSLKPMSFQMSSDLLTRAISPAQLKPVNLSLNPSPVTLSNSRLKTAVATGRVAPLISRRAIQPALMQPALSRSAQLSTSSINRDAIRLDAATLKQSAQVRPIRTNIPSSLVNRVELIQRESFSAPARAQVVDMQGQGIYQANVRIRTQTGDRQALTGNTGHFATRLTPGRYEVFVQKAGFAAASGMITVPQKGTPPVIQMKPQVTEGELVIYLKEESSGQQQPFTGSAKVVIEGNNSQQIMMAENQHRLRASLKPGQYTVTVVSETADQILPAAKQTVDVRPSSGSSRVDSVMFRLVSAPKIVNPDIQLLGVICRQVPACPT